MKPERERVEVRENIDRQPTRRVLTYLFEHYIAQIIEQHTGKPCASIGRNQGNRERGSRFQAWLHPVDGGGINKAHAQLDALRNQNQQKSDDDPDTQTRLILGPEIGQKASHHGQIGHRGFKQGILRRHRLGLVDLGHHWKPCGINRIGRVANRRLMEPAAQHHVSRRVFYSYRRL